MTENIMTRKPKYSGSFYPADKKELSDMLSKMLSKSKPKKIKGELKC